MRSKVLTGLAVAATTVGMMAATAAPASADETSVTFNLAGGSLAVDSQATAALTNASSGVTSISGQLGNVVLTDARGGTTGWSVGATTGTFGNGTTNATAVSYNAGTADTSGEVTALGTGATTLTAEPAAVMNGTLVTGNNTATWNPALTVTLPSSSTAGNYTGIITTDLL